LLFQESRRIVAGNKKKIMMITPENKEINKFRRKIKHMN
jgi:hypothetical protein